MRTRAVAVALCLWAGPGLAADRMQFSESETRVILAHGPRTAPYGHDGKRDTLAEVVRHYSERGSKALPPLKLTAGEQTDLVVFLESVSTLSNPWRPEDHGRCH